MRPSRRFISFWLKRGVGGFRFDAITALYEDPSLSDEEVLKDKDGKPLINAYGDPVLNESKTDNLPGVHTVMQEMRAYADTFCSAAFPGTRVLIGETYLPNIAELAKMYGPPASRSLNCRWIRRWPSSTSWTWPPSAPD